MAFFYNILGSILLLKVSHFFVFIDFIHLDVVYFCKVVFFQQIDVKISTIHKIQNLDLD